MNCFVGIDVSKEKFDACGVGEQGEKVFSLACIMDREGFEKLTLCLPTDKESLLLGMESTASYHIALFSYLTANGYRVVVINPLLINGFSKRFLRKTKTDKKDALTIAQFLMREQETLSAQTPDYLATELKDLARRREKLADHVTSLKADMKRLLSVIFPELEQIIGVFTKSALRLLAEYPSAHALRKAGYTDVADILITRSRGQKSHASIKTIMEAAAASVGVESPAKELALRQETSLLIHVQEQTKEVTKLLMSLLNERMKQDMEILCSMKGIGENTAVNFLIEMGGRVEIFENDKKLIAASGLDPSTYQSGKYEGKSRISKRGNRHLRRVIWLMATKVIINNELFRTYFYKRRKEGLPYKKAVLATAHKLIRIMFVMLSRKTYFVEGGIKYS
ncbi:MAG: IS110 family transposase [Proteobacteria bacterium]|nr:IS110 family transposase [Pseudomonadota bacterium]